MACATECTNEAEENDIVEEEPIADVDHCLNKMFEAMKWDTTFRSITMKEVKLEEYSLIRHLCVRSRQAGRSKVSMLTVAINYAPLHISCNQMHAPFISEESC